MDQITQEQMLEYREAFDMFDRDCNGYISAEELETAIRSLGPKPTKAEIKAMMEEADINEDGHISFEEFCLMVQRNCKEGNDVRGELERAFNAFDIDGDGYITATELRQAMKKIGQPMTSQEIEEMIWEADKDGNGKIDYKEFADLLLSK